MPQKQNQAKLGQNKQTKERAKEKAQMYVYMQRNMFTHMGILYKHKTRSHNVYKKDLENQKRKI